VRRQQHVAQFSPSAVGVGTHARAVRHDRRRRGVAIGERRRAATITVATGSYLVARRRRPSSRP
jgi:hypothetical protein